MARVAVAFTAGAAFAWIARSLPPAAPLALLLPLALIRASRGPAVRSALLLSVTAGAVAMASASPVGDPWTAAPLSASAAVARQPAGSGARGSGRGSLERWRESLVQRIDRLYGARAPLVAALTLAHRDGLDRQVRERFARSGTAHLLAISGFHVGVVAAMLGALVRAVGVRRRRASLVAAAGTWAYVGLLGFPDAAFRAALILGMVALSRARGRPPARWGALGAALLFLLVLDPTRLVSPGFQLSFAGAAGLVGWAPGLRAGLGAATRGRLPTSWISSVAAGIAATLATLPVVAWHFERVSLVGIPATLLASPLVALALPGALASLVADLAWPGLGAFLAGGVDSVLAVLEWGIARAAEPGWASAWVSRTWVLVASAGGATGLVWANRPRVRRRVRHRVALVTAAAAVVAWPGALALQGRGTLELLVLDVGQGDALALRTPAGRWLLVDAGPPGPPDPGGHRVVRALRRRGVSRLEALVLTHPDLDHIGGAEAVLASLSVAAVWDPARGSGKEAYAAALAEAERRHVPWVRAQAGRTMELDGVVLEVLYPEAEGRLGGGVSEDTDSNDQSVVLAARFGDLDILLTGDAPAGVERRLAPVVGPVEVLKVAHHGSDTSTDPQLLAAVVPAVALISVGRRNRYGHPSAEVIRRLQDAGVPVRRTDREGSLRVVGRRDGSFRVEARGSGGR